MARRSYGYRLTADSRDSFSHASPSSSLTSRISSSTLSSTPLRSQIQDTAPSESRSLLTVHSLHSTSRYGNQDNGDSFRSSQSRLSPVPGHSFRISENRSSPFAADNYRISESKLSTIGGDNFSISESTLSTISGDDSKYSENRLSPKPIKKYGRTTHSQAFSASSTESSFLPEASLKSHLRSLDSSGDTSSWTSHRIRREYRGKDKTDKLGETRGTRAEIIINETKRIRETESEANDSSNRRTSQRERSFPESKMKEGKDEKTDKEVNLSLARSTKVNIYSDEVGSSDSINQEIEDARSYRRLMRLRRLEEKQEGASASSASEQSSRGDARGRFSRVDSGVIDCEPDVKIADIILDTAPSGGRLVSGVTSREDDTGKLRKAIGRDVSPGVTVTVESYDSGAEHNDSGVHLDEPTSPATNRLSGHVTSGLKSQWTEEDLDAFVRQLSNPQRHVAKSGLTDQRDSSPVRKRSPELAHDCKDRNKTLVGRLEKDVSSSVTLLHSTLEETDESANNGDDVCKASGLISSLSGLRLIKTKKSVQTSHANAKRSALQRSRDLQHTASCTQENEDVEPTTTPARDASERVCASPGSSSPEGSDGEVCGDKRTLEQSSNGANKEAGKKRRFRKMLTRPLNRSQSAGCAKDVPAHALFLAHQLKKSKEAEWIEARKSRSSEGDIRHVKEPDDNDDAEEEGAGNAPDSARNKRNHIGKIHKTKSADSAMMALDDLGAISQAKSKSRNIAKKISKKMQFLRRRHTDSTLGVMGRDEGARRLASVDPEEALEWSRSFETLLFDKTGLELFRGFLMSEHSDENIEFWIACENYKCTKSNKQLPSLAMKIFNDYVAVQSKKEINLDSKTRNDTYESVNSNPTRQTFDEAQRRVQALMEKDSYRRFLESEIYQDLAAGNIQHKS